MLPERYWGREFDVPARLMPWGDMWTVMDRFLQDATSLATDIEETKDGYKLMFDAPGMRAEDIDVSVEGNDITVTCKCAEQDKQKEGQKDKNMVRQERRRRMSASRTIELPEAVDENNVQATLKDGILTINVKKAPEARKKIAVQTA